MSDTYDNIPPQPPCNCSVKRKPPEAGWHDSDCAVQAWFDELRRRS